MRFFTIAAWLLLVALCAAPSLYAQSLRPIDRIKELRANKSFEAVANPLVPYAGRSAGIAALDKVGAEYDVFTMDKSIATELLESAPGELTVRLPRSGGEDFRLQLYQVNPLAPGFVVRETGNPGYSKVHSGLHYRGVLAGQDNSLVALSVIDGEISGTISTDAGNYVLGKLQSDERHVLYNDHDLPTPDLGECSTPDPELPYRREELIDQTGGRDASNCVNLFIELDYTIFVDRGSSTDAAVAWMTAVFNQVAVLYNNENVNIAISEIFVNTSDATDLDRPTQTGQSLLSNFRSRRPAGSYNGDLAAYVADQREQSGGVAFVNALCSSYGHSYSGVRSTYSNVPSYSWTVNVLAHEWGHNLGSSHTHACVWNGNGTAIDGCYPTTGDCPRPAIPSGGGTIMSYCHLTSAGISFNNGFGTQPGNLIRNRVYNASCLTTCSGGGNPGGPTNPPPPPPPPGGGDPTTEVVVTLKTDNYPTEISWELRTKSGSVIGRVAAGSYSARNTTYTTTVQLKEDCYVFDIKDGYGDGICCSYGQGNYKVTVDGTEVATGGNYGRGEAKEFCVGNGGGDDGGGGDDDGECAALDFGTYPPVAYGGSQDRGQVTVTDANSIRIQGNAWKAIRLNYTVTPNTVLEFEFGSTTRGEIHGIGFDNDDRITSSRNFQLFGTQNWGIGDYKNYATTGQWKAYSIPVGQFYTGSFSRLFFTCDDDRNARATSLFRNVRIYEGTDCVALNLDGAPQPIQDEAATAGNLATATGEVSVYPNPTSDQLTATFALPSGGSADVSVYDLRGRRIQQLRRGMDAGEQRVTVPVDRLPNGAYVLRVTAAEGYTATAKFNVLR